MRAKFTVERSSNRQWYFVLKASNGQVIATSETYTTKAKCLKGIRSVRRNALIAKLEDKT